MSRGHNPIRAGAGGVFGPARVDCRLRGLPAAATLSPPLRQFRNRPMSFPPRLNGIFASRTAAGALFLLATALFLIRLAAPSDLRDNDQERPAAYAMDILRNGRWVVQSDHNGEVMSKPPLSTWLTAVPALPFGRLNLFLLYLPSFLAVVATVLLMHRAGERRLGPEAGFLAAVLFLCSMVALKEVALSRADPVFSVLVFGSALVAFRAWNGECSWTPFWLLAAAGTLTKGPLGVPLALGGLLAFLGERPRRNPLRGNHLPGLLIFLVLTLGWFGLACLAEGHRVAEKMIFRELVGHAVKDSPDGFEFAQLAKPTLYFFSRFAPWSLLAAAGIVFALRRARSGSDPTEMRFRRFLAAQVLFGLGLFSLSPHQRPDHLMPLVPSAALLAGHTAACFVGGWPPARLRAALAALVLFFLASVAIWGFFIRAKAAPVRETAALRDIATGIRQDYGPRFAPEFVEAPYAFQFFLGTMKTELRPDIAAGLLASKQKSGDPFFIITEDPEAIGKHLPSGGSLHRLRQWRLPGGSLWLVSNHEALPRSP